MRRLYEALEQPSDLNSVPNPVPQYPAPTPAIKPKPLTYSSTSAELSKPCQAAGLMEIKPLPTNVCYSEQHPADDLHQPPKVILDPVERPPDFREVDIFFESPSPTHKFYSVRDRWALVERDMLLADTEKPFPECPMPETPISQLIKLVRENPNFRGDWTGFYTGFLDLHPDENNADILAFVETVENTRVMCINTIGTNLVISDFFGRTRPRVMLSVGTLTGQVLFFNDISIINPRILHFIKSPTYVKIGSGLDLVFEELKRVDIPVKNWVETGAMRLALYPPTWTPLPPSSTRFTPKVGAMPFDIGIQIEDLLKAGFLKEPYSRTLFNEDWLQDPKFTEHGQIPRDALPHLLENTRIPCAEAILIAAHFAIQRQYSISEPIFPILFEAFSLCHARDPKDFQRTLDPWRPEVNYWMALLPTGTRLQQAALPASCNETTMYRKAMADFVEPVYPNFKPTDIAEVVYQHFFGPNPIEFPTHEELRGNHLYKVLLNRCKSCAQKGHSAKDCPINKNPTCNYEHDGEICEPHSILCCPILHGYCNRCFHTGHHERVHYDSKHLKTQREVRQRFFRFMAHGAFTSMPYLMLHPEGRKKVAFYHWSFAHDGRKYRKAVVTRYVLGVHKHLSTDDIAVHTSDNALWRKNIALKFEAVQKNINATTYSFVPAIRDFMNPTAKATVLQAHGKQPQPVQTTSPAFMAQVKQPAILAKPARPAQEPRPVRLDLPVKPILPTQLDMPFQQYKPVLPAKLTVATKPAEKVCTNNGVKLNPSSKKPIIIIVYRANFNELIYLVALM